MLQAGTIKKLVIQMGADVCGIASVGRFHDAPAGFSPRDIYAQAQSVIVFGKQIPSESLFAQSCIPYTHANDLAMRAVDTLTFNLSLALERRGIKNVLIPSDDPYEYWDGGHSMGRAILSLRHAGYLAGLGRLGKNTLLINQRYGSMLQLGAVLTSITLEPDPIATYQVCSAGCRRCLEECPTHALDGMTVHQDRCRPLSCFKNEKGYVLKKCYMCRKVCPSALGIRGKFSKSKNKA